MNTEQASLQELTEGFLQSAMALLYSLKSGDYRCLDKHIIDCMEKDPEYLPKYAIALSERVIIAMVNSGHFESPEDTKRHFVKLMLFNEMIQWGELTEEEDNERWELYNKIVNAMVADSEFVEFIYGRDA